jgi:hypothetical protein
MAAIYPSMAVKINRAHAHVRTGPRPGADPRRRGDGKVSEKPVPDQSRGPGALTPGAVASGPA